MTRLINTHVQCTHDEESQGDSEAYIGEYIMILFKV